MREYELPTREECFSIIEEYRVAPHIVRHSRAVARLAVFLAERLKGKGIPVDVELLERACLLHDIVRVCDFKDLDFSKFDGEITEKDTARWEGIRERFKDISHEYAAYEILKDKYPRVALTIKRHRYMDMPDEKERPNSWEEKLLFYSDLRVMHEKVVPLGERLEDGHKRNVHLHGTEAQSRVNTAKVDPLIYGLEAEIFNVLGLDPLSVTDELVESYLR